jgi:hypothetical protein
MKQAHGKLIRRVLGAAALAAKWSLLATFAAAAQAGVVVRPDPPVMALMPQAQGTAVVLVENVADLYGLEAHLTFDPNIVEVVDSDAARPGVQVGVADWLEGGFVATNQADNRAGKIDLAATLVNPAPPYSGTGPFMSITFKAKQNGISPLSIAGATLVTRDADVIAAQLQEGSIGISADGSFPVAKPPAPGAGVAAAAAIPAPGAAAGRGSLLSLAAFLSIVAFMAASAVLVYAIKR